MFDNVNEPSGPPAATLSKRAQSYSDFHYAVRAVLGQDGATTDDQTKTKSENKEPQIKNDLDFADWYNDLEDQLLDSSHKDYV